MASASDSSAPKSYSTDPALYIYTSLTAGSSHIVTATSRLETILRANRVPFKAIDIATDEKARMLWGRRAGKDEAGRVRKLPGLVQMGLVLGVSLLAATPPVHPPGRSMFLVSLQKLTPRGWIVGHRRDRRLERVRRAEAARHPLLRRVHPTPHRPEAQGSPQGQAQGCSCPGGGSPEDSRRRSDAAPGSRA